MRITIDISQVAYRGSGVANYTGELVKQLLKLDRTNSYCLFGYSFGLLENLKEIVRDLPPHPKLKTVLIRLPQTLLSAWGNSLHRFNIENLTGESDIFHSSDWIQFPSRSLKVTTVHDLVAYLFPETSSPLIVSQQRRRMEHVKKEADLIFSDSESTKIDLGKILKIKPTRIRTIYPGVNSLFQAKTDNEDRMVLGKYGIKGRYFLAVGTQELRKNLETACGAFELFRQKLTDTDSSSEVFLVLTGKKGWSGILPQVQNMINAGMVPDTELAALYRRAEALLFPSLYEGFGFTVLEAMKSGCPVITSRRGSLPEVGGGAVLYADPENRQDLAGKIYRLYSDGDFRRKLVEKGFIQSGKFSWQKTAAEVLENYEQLFKKAKKE